MTLLLDTHALLWFVWDDQRLSATARDQITDPDNRKLVSIVTCWEISIKSSLGKLQLGAPAGLFLHQQITQNNFELLPITLSHAAAVETLPLHHRDPFDRLLVAQALHERICLVSVDTQFDEYGVWRSW